MGGTVKATKAFDEVIEPTVKRVSLIESFNDEKIEAVNVLVTWVTRFML